LCRHSAKRHAPVARDHIRYFGSEFEQAPVVIARSKPGHHLAAEAAHYAVRKNRLQPVAHFNIIFVVSDSEQDEHPAVVVLVANAPALEELISEVGSLQAFERVDGNDSNLGVSFLINFGAKRGQLLLGLLAEHPGEVVDVALGFELRYVFPEGRRVQGKEQEAGDISKNRPGGLVAMGWRQL